MTVLINSDSDAVLQAASHCSLYRELSPFLNRYLLEKEIPENFFFVPVMFLIRIHYYVF